MEQEDNMVEILQGSVREKMKGGIGLRGTLSMVIATNLTSICCVYTNSEVQNWQHSNQILKINLIPNRSFRCYTQ